MIVLEDNDKRLLEMLQQDFPLVLRPFQKIGDACDLTEAQVLEQIHKFREAHLIRDLCAFFNLRRMGWQSTLVACEVGDEYLEAVVARINAHPGVSHNYQRDHKYNIWFTLASPNEKELDEALIHICRPAMVKQYRIFPSLYTFKIGVNFRFSKDTQGIAGNPHFFPEEPVALTAHEKQVILRLSATLPICAELWEEVSGDLGITTDCLFAVIRELKGKSVLKRIAVLLYHRNAGFCYNAMVCFKVPVADIHSAGTRIAGFREVSHCYQRPTYPDWPYSLFAMVHAQTRAEYEDVIRKMKTQIQCPDYIALFSKREFKKAKIQIPGSFYESEI